MAETNTAHTPGPWAWHEQDGSLCILGQDGCDLGPGSVLNVNRCRGCWDKHVASGGGGPLCGYPNEADARLIAAAPDLLAFAECVEAYNQSRTSNDWMGVFDGEGWDHKENPTSFLHTLRSAAIAKATQS